MKKWFIELKVNLKKKRISCLEFNAFHVDNSGGGCIVQ